MDEPTPSIGELGATGLKDRLDRGEPLTVLDVREPHERTYAAIALPTGVVDLHVPMGEIARRFGEIKGATSGRPLVVYCHHGQRSMVAASWLSLRGIADVHNLDGGIDSWSRRVDPGVPRY